MCRGLSLTRGSIVYPQFDKLPESWQILSGKKDNFKALCIRTYFTPKTGLCIENALQISRGVSCPDVSSKLFIFRVVNPSTSYKNPKPFLGYFSVLRFFKNSESEPGLGVPKPGCFKSGCFQFLRGSALFALFCALVFALFCGAYDHF